jgi:hypothetical protein
MKIIGYRKESFIGNHPLTDSFTKFLHLFPYIAEKGITGPLAQKHNCEYWDSSKVHCHSSTTSGRMETQGSWWKT